jgi:hypothetical protein
MDLEQPLAIASTPRRRQHTGAAVDGRCRTSRNRHPASKPSIVDGVQQHKHGQVTGQVPGGGWALMPTAKRIKRIKGIRWDFARLLNGRSTDAHPSSRSQSSLAQVFNPPTGVQFVADNAAESVSNKRRIKDWDGAHRDSSRLTNDRSTRGTVMGSNTSTSIVLVTFWSNQQRGRTPAASWSTFWSNQQQGRTPRAKAPHLGFFVEQQQHSWRSRRTAAGEPSTGGAKVLEGAPW